MSMICGDAVTLIGAGANVESWAFTINLGADKEDVTTFGAGTFIQYVSCNPKGSFTISHREPSDLSAGSSGTLIIDFGSFQVTVPVLVETTSAKANAHGGALADFTTAGRVNGDVTWA